MTSQDKHKIEIMTQGGKILSRIMHDLVAAVTIGVSTAQINDLANELCRKHGVKPAFLGYNGYPASLCASVNSVVVHGIPNTKPLKEGDLVGLDFGIIYRGYCLDCARTKYLGKPNKAIKTLIDVTQQSLDAAQLAIVPNQSRVGNIGFAVESLAKKNNLGLVRDLAGHGVGKKLQEEPSIPNYGRKGTGVILKSGMTIAIEPMLTLGTSEVNINPDGWSVITRDNSLSAHFEDTFAILSDKVVNLTADNVKPVDS